MEEEGHSDLISFQPTDSDIPSFLEDCNRVRLALHCKGQGSYKCLLVTSSAAVAVCITKGMLLATKATGSRTQEEWTDPSWQCVVYLSTSCGMLAFHGGPKDLQRPFNFTSCSSKLPPVDKQI